MSSRELYIQRGIAPDMPVSEMLWRAIARLQQGWTKGDFYDGNGGACALGAIAEVAKGRSMKVEDYRKAEARLLQVLKDMHPMLTANTIPELNDDPAVTLEDIVMAFEKTALMAEEGTL